VAVFGVDRYEAEMMDLPGDERTLELLWVKIAVDNREECVGALYYKLIELAPSPGLSIELK